jgi:hypothetical protein
MVAHNVTRSSDPTSGHHYNQHCDIEILCMMEFLPEAETIKYLELMRDMHDIQSSANQQSGNNQPPKPPPARKKEAAK